MMVEHLLGCYSGSLSIKMIADNIEPSLCVRQEAKLNAVNQDIGQYWTRLGPRCKAVAVYIPAAWVQGLGCGEKGAAEARHRA